MWMGGQLHAPAALSLGKEPPLPTEMEGGLHLRTSLDALIRQKYLPLQETELQYLGCPVYSLFTV
jgi:hypothetical protein